jgi:ABC-type transport system involved in multi-copper enzyme maturation permease subunit
MAVYKQTYAPYEGPLSDDRWRFAVLARYSFLSVFESKLLAMFFALCFIPPLLAGGILYAQHNAKALEGLFMGGAVKNLQIDRGLFVLFFRTQAFLSFLLVTFVGPGLVSADTANSALCIYLSKPFSAAEYVLGRLSVLLALTSAVTWLPTLVLAGIRTDLAGFAWLSANYRVVIAFVLGYWLWIVLISVLALAVSAAVKWRPLATGSLLVLFFAAAGLGVLTNQILQLDLQWGLLLSLDSSISIVFGWLLDGVTQQGNIPAWAALGWLAILFLLSAAALRGKIRA